MITFSEPRDQIVEGLFVCDENLGELKKNAQNPHFKSKYADLGATCDAIQPGLTAGKLLVIQVPLTAPDGAVGVETMLLHRSGQWCRPDPFFLPLAKADPQGAGSAVTYARRYALAAFFNLAPEDDDANGASGKPRHLRSAAPADAPPTERIDEARNALRAKADAAATEVRKLQGDIVALGRALGYDKDQYEAALAAQVGKPSLAGVPISQLRPLRDYLQKLVDHTKREVADAETPASPPTNLDNAPQMHEITHRRLFAMLKERGIVERDDRLFWAHEQGVEVKSFSELLEPTAVYLCKRAERLPVIA